MVNSGKPYIRIVEQPAERSFRFRYESECRLGGCIVGANTSSTKTTYPKLEIGNLNGYVEITVSCVTDTNPYRQHPHNLLSKNQPLPGGFYKFGVNVNKSGIVELKDIGIIFTKKSNIKAKLSERKKHEIDPFAGKFVFYIKYLIIINCL